MEMSAQANHARLGTEPSLGLSSRYGPCFSSAKILADPARARPADGSNVLHFTNAPIAEGLRIVAFISSSIL